MAPGITVRISKRPDSSVIARANPRNVSSHASGRPAASACQDSISASDNTAPSPSRTVPSMTIARPAAFAVAAASSPAKREEREVGADRLERRELGHGQSTIGVASRPRSTRSNR